MVFAWRGESSLPVRLVAVEMLLCELRSWALDRWREKKKVAVTAALAALMSATLCRSCKALEVCVLLLAGKTIERRVITRTKSRLCGIRAEEGSYSPAAGEAVLESAVC